MLLPRYTPSPIVLHVNLDWTKLLTVSWYVFLESSSRIRRRDRSGFRPSYKHGHDGRLGPAAPVGYLPERQCPFFSGGCQQGGYWSGRGETGGC